MTTIHHPIVIIGAGLSGLTAAFRLKQQGLAVHLYEARQRVGGRVLTVNINRRIGELGAQNILDGGKSENILKLIADLQIKTENGKQMMMSYYDTGTDLINRIKALRQYKGLPDERSLPKHLQKLAELSHNMAEVIQALFPDHPILRKLFALFLMGYEGAPVEKLSTFYAQSLSRWIAPTYRLDDDPVYFEFTFIQGGSALLAEKMAAQISDHLHLEMPLQSLQKDKRGRYLLRFVNEQMISADQVVLAIPCRVYEDIAFDEQVISHDRLRHIHKVVYGNHAKILVPLKAGEPPTGVYVNDRFAMFSFIATNLVTMYYFNQFRDFDPAHIGNIFCNDSIFLKKIYENYLLPVEQTVYARDESYADYDSAVGYDWATDPYAKGSYSCIGAGQDDIFTITTQYHGEMVKQLFAPIEDRLFFAGEHTSILMDAIGTMEAAVEAGERIARMIFKKGYL